MLALYIAYAVLIVAVIVILPLHIRARRQTLKDIDALRSTFQKNMEQLLSKIESINIEKPTESEQLEEDRILHMLLRQRPYGERAFIKSGRAFHYGRELSTMEESFLGAGRLGQYAQFLQALSKEKHAELTKLRECPWKQPEQEQEDVWFLTKERANAVRA